MKTLKAAARLARATYGTEVQLPEGWTLLAQYTDSMFGRATLYTLRAASGFSTSFSGPYLESVARQWAQGSDFGEAACAALKARPA